MPGDLTDIAHVIVVAADGVAAADRPALAARATEVRAYHLPPAGEDRRGAWEAQLGALRSAGFTVDGRSDPMRLAAAIGAGDLPEVAVANVDDAGLDRLVAALDRSPRIAASTLLAVELAGGDALPVRGPDGALGDPGTLLLLSPWTPGGWVGEEVADHTSLLGLLERWAADRGRPVPSAVPAWRRALCGDLHRMLELRDPSEVGAFAEVAGRRLGRPVPYFPVAELRIGEDGVALRLGNVGPVAAAPAPLVVDDGDTVRPVVVPPSPLDDQELVRVPVAVRDGRYDVTVLGPDHFRRRFAGSFPDSGVHCEVEHVVRDPWFPTLTLTVWCDIPQPTLFWMERRLGERAASKAAGYGSGVQERVAAPRRTARFKEEPGANTFGWYDVAVTTSADPSWTREYAGHLPTGIRPTLAY